MSEPLEAPKTIEELQAEVRNLNALLNANETRGQKATVTTADSDGAPKTYTVADLSADLSEVSQMLHRSTLEAKRHNDEQERRNPIPTLGTDGQIEWRRQNEKNAPILAKAEAIKLHGLLGWGRLTNFEKAQALDVRETDISSLNPRDFFGHTSNTIKSVELMRTNPTAYKLLKQRAVKEGIF